MGAAFVAERCVAAAPQGGGFFIAEGPPKEEGREVVVLTLMPPNWGHLGGILGNLGSLPPKGGLSRGTLTSLQIGN